MNCEKEVLLTNFTKNKCYLLIKKTLKKIRELDYIKVHLQSIQSDSSQVTMVSYVTETMPSSFLSKDFPINQWTALSLGRFPHIQSRN